VKGNFSSGLTRRDLVSLKGRALRRGVWFRVLGRIERALVDSAIWVVDRVRSPVLFKALVSIVKKLEDAFDNRILRVTRTVGFPGVQKLSLLAQKWGNKSAQSWMFDLSFARFIAIMHVNSLGLSPC
jgi:hypothetical protein